LAATNATATQRQLRNAARMRDSHVADILADVIETGRVSRSTAGYQLRS
jgi:hypothetical protein